ncbi:prohibitin family protein [Brumimicrobium glaciale]|jgi:regulator of protease activity HflC (stomatin/prohibitin superfamily)|uniref:Prohibitin family protein n=1 Tax=Brumimicrobium glaciale TaxID=200475 RepID=A0A4Q4KSQ2_9FLAO|nr:prohibitin family protein [Brumimicrobium glaciale]RYM35089.1 prohibitin family protein [Brumimicrobium glaciale]
METKQMVRYVAIGAVALIVFVIFFNSWTDVEPGEQGFVFKPFNTPSITEKDAFVEGTYFILPWNEMITYEVVNKSKQYVQKVMDVNGTDVTVEVSVNYNIIPAKVANLHIKHRENYTIFIDDKSKGAIKDVIGRYTYEQVYSTKREALEGEIEAILERDFEGNFLNLNYVEIADVNLPDNIAAQIEEKETQKQRNLTAKEKQKEQEYLANARIEKARGDSSLIVSAIFKAEAIRLEAEQISKNPQYIELKKWEKWDGVGSPYGNSNVFGDKAISILKSN